MTTGVRKGLVVGVLSVVSLIGGALLIAIGAITRQERAVAAGKRRFHGLAFERRWIPDLRERRRHDVIIGERLDLPTSPDAAITVAEAADKLGVSVSTVRRRAKRGQLEGVYHDGRLTGIILGAE